MVVSSEDAYAHKLAIIKYNFINFDLFVDLFVATLPLSPFRGNRFNILFSNARHLFFLRRQMVEYLGDTDHNLLLKCVLHDLKVTAD